MKCLNCGRENDRYLCDACSTADVLDKIFNDIRSFKPETCDNPYLMEYASTLSDRSAVRDIIPAILDYFDSEISEWYYCRYFKISRDNRFEERAISYLNRHDSSDIRAQNIMYDLVDSYIPNDFIKPKKWCEIISENENFCCELYAVAAKYYAMIGEYDRSDSLVDRALNICNTGGGTRFLFYSLENMVKVDFQSSKIYWHERN
jgi:hypothetical protein